MILLNTNTKHLSNLHENQVAKYLHLIFCLAMGLYTPSLIKYGNSIITLNAVWHAVYNYLALKRNGEFLDLTKKLCADLWLGQPVSRDQVFKPNLSNFGYLAMAILSLFRLRRGPASLRSTEFLVLGLVSSRAFLFASPSLIVLYIG